MIKILIADDHVLIREGFKKLINREVDMEVTAEARNASEVIEKIRNQHFDVIVLDIHMPGKSGLELLKDLRERDPDTKVLILSMHPEDRFAVRSLKAGAYGYITKESAPDELVEAVRKIYAGNRYVSPKLAEMLASDLTEPQEEARHQKLSDREFQILQLIGEGNSVLEIAEELSLSQSTVNTYRHRILEKMKMNSTAELIHYVVKNNLID